MPEGRRKKAKSALRSLAVAAARTGPGARTISSILRAEPELASDALFWRFTHGRTFRTVSSWPKRVDGFEDLAFLFSSNLFNMGTILLALDEASYLYGLVRRLGPATIVEIGRYKGGSTFLIAAAMDSGAELYSYDLHVPVVPELRGEDLDRGLEEALERYGLADRVHVIVGDSRTAETPASDLVFVDGDHSYEGVRADYEHWRGALRPDGHLLFHDAAAPRDFVNFEEGVARLVDEIARDDGDYFVRAGGAGALVHFTRTDVAAPWDTLSVADERRA